MVNPIIIANGGVFAGRYHVVRCIAHGGMGAIYEVIHLETQRRRALKVILPNVLHSAELRERFRQEARVAAQIESEHIVDVFDAGVDEPTKMPFLIMELLKGEELGVRLERLGKFEPADVVTYLRQTAIALDKTHAANIVHRDLKPENLFLTQRDDGQPRIKVLDFGIAKVVADGATRSGATRSVGTPLYMAPAQFAPGSHVAPATDIYAFGMMAYTLLVGETYFYHEAEQTGNMYAFAAVVVEGVKEPASVRARRRGVSLPPAFDAWFARVTARDPKQRPQKASMAIAELANVFGINDGRGSLPSAPSYHPEAMVPSPAAKAVAVAGAAQGRTVPLLSEQTASPGTNAVPLAHQAGVSGSMPTRVWTPAPQARKDRGAGVLFGAGLVIVGGIVTVFLVVAREPVGPSDKPISAQSAPLTTLGHAQAGQGVSSTGPATTDVAPAGSGSAVAVAVAVASASSYVNVMGSPPTTKKTAPTSSKKKHLYGIDREAFDCCDEPRAHVGMVWHGVSWASRCCRR